MRLTLAVHTVTDIRFGSVTRLEGTRLQVDREALRRHLLDDRRLRGVDLETVRPGESCRAGFLFDIVEPRAKEPGKGVDFPGILGPYALAGQGTTHVLRGSAVTVLDEGIASGGKVVEMSGPAAQASPYGSLQHLVVVPRLQPELPRAGAMDALRTAGLRTAVYLARVALGHSPSSMEVFDLEGPATKGREGLPRIDFIGQVHGHQHMMEPGDRILYGSDTRGMLPAVLHPNEWLDGAVVLSYWNNHPEETYLYQNHPVVLELYRRHQAGEITFAGTIAMAAASNEEDRNRNCLLAAHLAQWSLGADGAVLTKYGGGAPHADMGETARLCEALGVRTSVAVTDSSGDRRVESAMLFNHPAVNAIVYIGGQGTRWKVPAAERVIAGNPMAAEALRAPQDLGARNVVGVANQQGASRLRSVAY